MSALLKFESHIRGKNARVEIHPDRIEWSQKGRITATRALGGALVTGSLRKGGGTEMVLIRHITSVTTKKDGFTNWAVSVIVAGNTLDMRVSKAEAEQIKATLLNLMNA